jgi:hypothetical protein
VASQFKKNFEQRFDRDAFDPWAVLQHYEELLTRRLTELDGKPFESTCTVKFEDDSAHRADSVVDLRGMVRPFEEDDIRSISFHRQAYGWPETSVWVWIWFKDDNYKLDVDVEGGEETFVLGWREALRQEAAGIQRARSTPPVREVIDGGTAASSATPAVSVPAPPPAAPSAAPVPAPVPAPAAPPAQPRRFHTWLGDVSAEVAGGLLLVIILAVGGVLWRLLS